MGLGFIKKLLDFGTTYLFSTNVPEAGQSYYRGKGSGVLSKNSSSGTCRSLSNYMASLGVFPWLKGFPERRCLSPWSAVWAAERRRGLAWQSTEMVHALESLSSAQEAQEDPWGEGEMKKLSLTNVLVVDRHWYPRSVCKNVPCPVWHVTCPGRGRGSPPRPPPWLTQFWLISCSPTGWGRFTDEILSF